MAFNITCSTDDNYIQHCIAMLCSLFENNQEYEFILHLLHHGLSKNGQMLISDLSKRYNNSVVFYDIDESKLGNVKIAENHPNLSMATYYRLSLPSLLDNSIDKILYLDCDVIVLGDVKPLYQLELFGYGLAAVRDCTPNNDAHRQVMGLPLDGKAFCAGVLMINLDYWRTHNSQDNMLKYANEMGERLFMEDQDILNHEFRNHWFQLPYKYGYTPMSIAPLDINQRWEDIVEYTYSPIIIHFASNIKPWLNIRIPKGHYYWDYVKLSGYPDPKETLVPDNNKHIIEKIKYRYYINLYVHPFIPDIIEIVIKDIYKYISCLNYIFKPKQFKKYLLKLWLSKYHF